MKAHRTDLVSFAFGLIFLGLALWWLLARILGLAVPPVGWFLAGGLVVIGLLGLVGALRSVRGPEQPAPPASPGQPDHVAAADQAAPPDQATRPGQPERSDQPAGPETTVAAPYRDGSPTGAVPAPADADEWATSAVTDEPAPARVDRPADDDPVRSPAEPATEELSTVESEGSRGPATRELPPVRQENDEPHDSGGRPV
ncbi:hypothetical protein O7602_02955 [Micromonospora sp. WMMD1128]|uniref:hypothetical protein n=1 Tax=unclassified Micromonospora TaxID=2617518 RepID=UPI00248CC8C7|nr:MULTISPECIES: hypothetical protein [unclassified Micromonospora]WBB77243.1 hypothetical protein O7602_02955 [Micromonospora sp. WMMD1128]WFE36891.1 hypothetical protein O7613_21295 [Micromonospora sp. WMMD975]